MSRGFPRKDGYYLAALRSIWEEEALLSTPQGSRLGTTAEGIVAYGEISFYSHLVKPALDTQT